MECGICERGFSAGRKPTCASCTQATLYGPRIQQAASLLSREKVHAHVEAIVRPGNDGILAALPEDADWDAITGGIKTHSFERAKAEQEAAEEKVKVVTEKAEGLRRQIEEYRAVAADQKERNQRRRKDLATERTQLEKRKARASEPVNLAKKKAGHRLDKVHNRTMEARQYLCREVSSLGGLQKTKRGDDKTEYRLSSVPIPDLRDLNGTNGRMRMEAVETSSGTKHPAEFPELVSASLDSICRFLGICCHYLSIRLPAEIILPHNDFPHAAILPRDSSYRTSNVRYPGLGGSHSSSPETSRLLYRSDLSRPRLLQLDRPFAQLQKEDPKTAAFFLEGVSLLAYDLAWLCRTQGFDSVMSFDDISALGRNLYHLFPGKDSKSRNRPVLTGNVTSATNNTERTVNSASDSKPKFGSHSHGSLRHSLAGYEGFALFGPDSDWKVSVARLTDQLRVRLRDQTERAEWHYVDDTEWDEVLEDEKPVLVGGARRSLDAKGPAMSVMTVAPHDGTGEERTSRPKGNSGWMKVRGRGGET